MWCSISKNMLCILFLTVVFGGVMTDIKLSTTTITMEIGEVKSFEIEVKNDSISYMNDTFLLVKLQEGIVEVTPDNIRIDWNSNVSKYEIKLKALKAGKSAIFTTIEPSATMERNESSLLLIKVCKNNFIKFLSTSIGWSYFIAWSLSFYPQICINFKNNSVVGLSFDLVLFNFYGYSLYTVFNAGMFFITVIKEQYARKYPRSPIPVHFNDLIFSIHSVFTTVITIIQCMIYERGDQQVSVQTTLIVSSYLTITGIFTILAIADVLLWLDVLYLFSYFELIIAIGKYAPQVRLNYFRKTTQGWSILGVLLDFIGGVLSILQMILNGYNYGNWSIIVENPTKFGLGLVSVIYAIIFLYQHCVLYKSKLTIQQKQEKKKTLDNINKC